MEYINRSKDKGLARVACSGLSILLTTNDPFPATIPIDRKLRKHEATTNFIRILCSDYLRGTAYSIIEPRTPPPFYATTSNKSAVRTQPPLS